MRKYGINNKSAINSVMGVHSKTKQKKQQQNNKTKLGTTKFWYWVSTSVVEKGLY